MFGAATFALSRLVSDALEDVERDADRRALGDLINPHGWPSDAGELVLREMQDLRSGGLRIRGATTPTDQLADLARGRLGSLQDSYSA